MRHRRRASFLYNKGVIDFDEKELAKKLVAQGNAEVDSALRSADEMGDVQSLKELLQMAMGGSGDASSGARGELGQAT